MDEFREIRSQFDKLEELMRRLEQHLLSQEHGARQPRLAMEADGSVNTKTQERTEGATIAVEAMRGDSCTTEQKVQDEPKTSITFGVEAEHPDLPCREDVLVEDGATAPKSCLPTLEMRTQQQPPVAYLSPAKPLQLRGSLPTSYFFGSTRLRR